jgi:hypothetical protein
MNRRAWARNLFSLGFSLLACAVSGWTLYLTELRTAELYVLAAETSYLARDPNGSQEVLLVPVTVINRGLQEGAVHGFQLTVSHPETAAARSYFAAAVGQRPDAEAQPFSPISVAGQSAVSQALLFYPRHDGTQLIDRPGDYRLQLQYRASAPKGPLAMAISFWRGPPTQPAWTDRRLPPLERTLPYYSLPELSAGRTIRMRPSAWSPSASSSMDSSRNVPIVGDASCHPNPPA